MNEIPPNCKAYEKLLRCSSKYTKVKKCISQVKEKQVGVLDKIWVFKKNVRGSIGLNNWYPAQKYLSYATAEGQSDRFYKNVHPNFFKQKI